MQGECPKPEFSRNGMGVAFFLWLSAEDGIATAFEVMNGPSNQLKQTTCKPCTGTWGSIQKGVNNSLDWQ